MLKNIVFILGSCALSFSATAQTTLWKSNSWEGHISSQGTLEQLIFKGAVRDTVPFFQQMKNAGPSFYADLGQGEHVASWIPDGHRSFRASICRSGMSVDLPRVEGTTGFSGDARQPESCPFFNR